MKVWMCQVFKMKLSQWLRCLKTSQSWSVLKHFTMVKTSKPMVVVEIPKKWIRNKSKNNISKQLNLSIVKSHRVFQMRFSSDRRVQMLKKLWICKVVVVAKPIANAKRKKICWGTFRISYRKWTSSKLILTRTMLKSKIGIVYSHPL